MDDSKWLRRATLKESYYNLSVRHQVFLIHYTLDLASVKPIEEDLLKRALRHLFRKVPVLRVCFQEKNSELWLREMKDCNVDLKIIEGGDLEKEKDKVTLHTYDSEEGPLWCVRFLPLGRTSPPSSSEQETKDFAYNYALIFGIHHVLVDGTTHVKICNLLCSIMNDLMSGHTIDDEQQLGDHVGDEEVQSLYRREMKKLVNDLELYKNIKEEVEEAAKVRPLNQHICKIPSDTVMMTRSVPIVFDQATTENLHQKAKSEGVGVHSTLTGLISLAFVELLRESGYVQDEYDIWAVHDMDMRKYYTGDTSSILGIHLPLYSFCCPFRAPMEMLPVFWKTLKAFQERFRSDINGGKVLTTVAYRMMTEDTKRNLKESFETDGKPNRYFDISNMGNLKGKLSEGGEFISIKKLSRFCSIQHKDTIMCVYAHTFRGQLNLNFGYSTRFLTEHFVQRLRERVETSMTSVCEM